MRKFYSEIMGLNMIIDKYSKPPSRRGVSLPCLEDKLFSGGAYDLVSPFQPNALVSVNDILNSKESFQLSKILNLLIKHLR